MTVQRSDLSWALRAALPHVGKTGTLMNQVGVSVRAGECRVYATDDNTFGVARIPDCGLADMQLSLPAKEAKDLELFVRPRLTTRGHWDEDVDLYVRQVELNFELHVGCDQGNSTTMEGEGYEARVFDLAQGHLNVDVLLAHIAKIAESEASHISAANPAYLGRFSEARKNESDRIYWYSHMSRMQDGRPTIKAIVAVGDIFVGAMAGMTLENFHEYPLASFLQTREQVA